MAQRAGSSAAAGLPAGEEGEQGYTGGYTQLTAFIRDWRQGEGKVQRAFIPLQFEAGEAFQFDWSEEGLVGHLATKCA